MYLTNPGSLSVYLSVHMRGIFLGVPMRTSPYDRQMSGHSPKDMAELRKKVHKVEQFHGGFDDLISF